MGRKLELHLTVTWIESTILLVYSFRLQRGGCIHRSPSLQDNLTNTVLEAMSCGLPVLSFRVGGIPEMVRDTETGRLADVGNATDLAQTILWMIEHSREREMMSKAARAYGTQEFHNAKTGGCL